MDVVRILIAILLPPLGVFLQVGIGLHFWLNILLTLCGYIPGIIHARLHHREEVIRQRYARHVPDEVPKAWLSPDRSASSSMSSSTNA